MEKRIIEIQYPDQKIHKIECSKLESVTFMGKIHYILHYDDLTTNKKTILYWLWYCYIT